MSTRYQDWLQSAGSARVRESARMEIPRILSPAELQSLWYSGEFPSLLGATDGTCVEVIHFGRWNPGHGPTFVDAQLSFDGQPPIQGGIEVHPDPLHWHRGANESADHNRTLLFVTSGSGVGGAHFSPSAAPATTLEGSLVREIRLDITAWEFAPAPPTPRGCHAPLAGLPLEESASLLEMAAQYRLSRKAARLQRLAQRFGPEEGLYHAIAEALGYRHNKVPFRILAQRFPLELIRRSPCPPEPFLFAGSGFLPSQDLSALEPDTRSYLRQIWQLWWPHRADFERLAFDHDDLALWQLHGARPVNHPHRRLAALAEIVRNWPIFHTLAREGNIVALRNFFTHLRHPYWDHHYTLTSKASRSRMALIGASRVHDILANIAFPLALPKFPAKWQEFRKLTIGATNQKLDLAIQRLWGENASFPKAFWKRTVHQQGLLQLFDDCCAAASYDCERCALNHRVASHQNHTGCRAGSDHDNTERR